MVDDKTKIVLAGLTKTTAAALSYSLFFVTGMFFLFAVKDSFVRFHAAQSIVVFVPLIVIQYVLGLTPIFNDLTPVITILIFSLWLVLIYKAWMGEEWEVPVLGEYSRKLVKKIK